MSEFEDKTYELCYNSACLSISKGNFDEAKQKLKKAEEIQWDYKNIVKRKGFLIRLK